MSKLFNAFGAAFVAMLTAGVPRRERLGRAADLRGVPRQVGKSGSPGRRARATRPESWASSCWA